MSLVTPDMALAWLGNRAPNRPVDWTLVRTIMRGWDGDDQPVHIASDGKLLNGQHRLWSVVLSRTPREMSVVTGCPTRASYPTP